MNIVIYIYYVIPQWVALFTTFTVGLMLAFSTTNVQYAPLYDMNFRKYIGAFVLENYISSLVTQITSP